MAGLKTKYEDIVNVDDIGQMVPMNLNTILELAAKEKIRPSAEDGKRVLLLLVDPQNDFCAEKGALPVWPGAKRDIENLTRFIYNNCEGITTIMASLDTHTPMQIFHPVMWQDADGNAPAPFTLITEDDIQANKYRCVHGNPVEVAKCLKALKAANTPLIIWPYHCLVGTSGWSIESELAKMIQFHSTVKVSNPVIVTKGTDTYSEMFGIIEPEYNPNNTVKFEILNLIADIGGGGKANYDEVYIGGEASSHCVLRTCQQILDRFKDNQDVLSRITVLTDCMSPVVGFEQQAVDGLEELKKQYGIRLANSTEITL